MKLSPTTIKILENYSKINANLLIQPGNVLKTLNEAKTVHSVVTVEDTFPEKFGIYDLSNFLNVLALFNDPDLTFNGNAVYIKDEDGTSSVYYSANYSMWNPVPDPKNFTSEMKFTLTDKNFKKLERAANTLKVEDIEFATKNKNIVATVGDASKASANTISVILGEQGSCPDFCVHISLSKLLMIAGDYECQIINNVALTMFNSSYNIVYNIALNAV